MVRKEYVSPDTSICMVKGISLLMSSDGHGAGEPEYPAPEPWEYEDDYACSGYSVWDE